MPLLQKTTAERLRGGRAWSLYVQEEISREKSQAVYSKVCGGITRDNSLELKQSKFRLGERKIIFSEGNQVVEHIVQRGYAVFILGFFLGLNGRSLEQPGAVS